MKALCAALPVTVRMLTLLSVAMLPALGLQGQLVADGATNTLSNVTNNISGDVTVGTNGSFTLLVLSNNALLTNSANGVIGLNTTAKSNEVRLINPSARWLMGSLLYLGSNGAFNRLVISNGATVQVASVSFIGLNAPASNNLALVTGPGSTWNAGQVWLGLDGTGNQLVVTNGGAVLGAYGYLGLNSSNNMAVVTGSGSTWSNILDLQIGNSSAANQLLVSNGGTVRNGHGYVGVNASTSNNVALVTGAGSVWTNALDLDIGYFSANNNQMFVSNGATVFAAGHGAIGLDQNASGNSATLSDAATRWWIGTDLYVGSNGAMSQLLVSNGAKVENNNGYLARRPAGSNNFALVTGANSVWTNRGDLTIGNLGAGNQMIVSNGGWVANRYGYLGSGSSNNFALVSGSGSVWSNSLEFFVGYAARSNRLVIEAGGLVSGDTANLGAFGGSNNEALVTGPGSAWIGRSSFTVGQNATMNNRLVVSNGAAVVSSGLSGGSLGGSSNQVVVTGNGSMWTNQSDFILGGAFNRLEVNQGGLLADGNAYLAPGSTVNSNTILVADSGTLWTNSGDFTLGGAGSGIGGSANIVVVSNGAAVVNANGKVGAATSLGNNNLMVLTGAGSLWSNRADLTVGTFSFGNRLIVTNGANLVVNSNSNVGLNTGGNSNVAVVTGAGSLWTSSVELNVGYDGSGNQLVISNGAGVVSKKGGVGYDIGSNNVAIVTGPGSFWNLPDVINNFMNIGGASVGNRLEIRDGATVRSWGATLGLAGEASNNLALVTGPGSLWTNSADFEVGYYGGSCQLVVSNAGMVVTGGEFDVGEPFAPASGNGNRVIVDGGTLRVANPASTAFVNVSRGTNTLNAGLMEVDLLILTNTQGKFEFNGGTLITRGANITNRVFIVGGGSGTNPAVWDVRAGLSNHLLTTRLLVGSNSSFNQVFVTNGAVLDGKDFTFLALNSGSNNVVTVSGPGSTFNSPLGLFIGADGDANRMTILNGGKVFANIGSSGTFIGRSVGTRSNSVTAADPGSQWLVNDYIYVGAGGSACQLMVSNGATVDSLIAYVGSTGNNNLAMVTGANSSWSNRSELYVGALGSGNQLVVSNGGTMINSNAYIGQIQGSHTNIVLVTGAGSLWNTRDSLLVGSDGSTNQLIVSNGGTVASISGFMGGSGLGGFNNALISDAGSLWSNHFDLQIGHESAFNVLEVSNQAQVLDRFGYVGFGTVDSDNGVIVTGAGSSWSNSQSLVVGSGTLIGNNNWLLVTNGGAAFAGADGIIGNDAGIFLNQATVTDPLSRWVMGGNLFVGNNGAESILIVTNGGAVSNQSGFIGAGKSSLDNLVQVTGVGSVWQSRSDLIVGNSGGRTLFTVDGGASAISSNGTIAVNGSSTNNIVTVTGAGSVWRNANSLDVGSGGLGNQLIVSNGGFVFAANQVRVGAFSGSTSNRLVVSGGSLAATNAPGTGILDVRRGTATLNAGTIEADVLLVTNAAGFFQLNGGTLSVRNSTVANGTLFRVGNGTNSATLHLAGNGLHDFSFALVMTAITVSSNATLSGNGSLKGGLVIQPGGRLSPGASIGRLTLSNTVSLQGTVLMEISRNGSALTNDQIQLAGPLTYGGSLIVMNIGPSALALGDRFQLFGATSFSGGFSNISLPPLSAGLNWQTNLLVDGSIQVVGLTFSGITLSGNNAIINGTGGTSNAPYAVLTTTNPALPLNNWVSIATNHFGPAGEFSITNSIPPGEVQRFFRIRTP